MVSIHQCLQSGAGAQSSKYLRSSEGNQFMAFLIVNKYSKLTLLISKGPQLPGYGKTSDMANLRGLKMEVD
jgi:hypothetical protein